MSEQDLLAACAEMAADEASEAEALDWAESLIWDGGLWIDDPDS